VPVVPVGDEFPGPVVPRPFGPWVSTELLPPLPRVKTIAITATAAAPTNARAGPFHLTGGHPSGN
jgi:hypothetical protein